MSRSTRILLTGATGYVGGRLLPLLVSDGFSVRCLARKPEYLQSRVDAGVEVVRGDVLDASSLEPAMVGIDTAVYLVHSMGSSADFADADRGAAENFGAAAKRAGVRTIVYLGGLGEGGEDLSAHLRSRQEVGDVLRSSGVAVIEFRASIVIGSGSLSFEMIRALVERLPVMITPRWVGVEAQPIAIEDLLAYLVGAVRKSGAMSRTYEIGGSDVVSYGELMREYARQRGLTRWMISVPVLTPRLSSLWLALVTPLYARIGRKLIGSIRHPTVVRDQAALTEFDVRPLGMSVAIARALGREDAEFAQSSWSDALSAGGAHRQWGGVRFGNRLVDSRSTTVAVSAQTAFAAIERIGGATGWYYGQWLWIVRGWLDLLLGGVGMRRGRRDPTALRVGDVVDCWRVDAIERGRRILLKAEMKLPGRAWLQFEVVPRDGVRAVEICQTATFDPHGLSGLAYWYGVWPLHQLVFAGMLRGIAGAATRDAVTSDRAPA